MDSRRIEEDSSAERQIEHISTELRGLARELTGLRSDPRNARRHPEGNLRDLEASLRAHGQRKPIVVREGVVLAGNGTLEVARRLGWTHLACVEYDGPEAMARAYALADNRSSDRATYDPDVLADTLRDLEAAGLLEATGYETPDLDGVLDQAGAVVRELEAAAGTDPGDEDDPIDYPGPGEPEDDEEADEGVTASKPGEVYELGRHLLVCGDSTDAEAMRRVLDGEQVDCVFTSPPYGVGVAYDNYEDTAANLRELLTSSAALWLSQIVDGGFAVVNFGDVVSGRAFTGGDEVGEYPAALEHYPVFRAAGWTLWTRRVWCKPNPRCAAPWTATSNRAATDFEHVWTWKKVGRPIVGRVPESNMGWWDTSRGPGVDVGKTTHGAGMPVAIAKLAIEVHSRVGTLVLDPFAGTGTTLIAAEASRRRCVAVELSPRYCDVIRKRWTQYAAHRGLTVGSGVLA